MGGDLTGSGRRLLPLYAACYLLWAALSALALLVALQVRLNILDLSQLLARRVTDPGDTVTAAGRLQALDNWSTIVLVLLWLAGVALLESYLRAGVAANRLWRRTARVLLPLLLVLAASYGLQALLG